MVYLLEMNLPLKLEIYLKKDREFIVTNKVTHIINCSGTEI